MSKYYLVHGVLDPYPEKILKILEDGYLYASSYTKKYGLFHGEPLDYVYFSLLGDENVSFGYAGVSFILDSTVLLKKTFRYALQWVGNDIDKSIKVDHKHDDVNQILNTINQHITSIDKAKIGKKLTSHEIMIKKRVNLHKYLVAICCESNLTEDIIGYIKKNYTNVILIDDFPNSAHELTMELKKYKPISQAKYKYKKYKNKYLNLVKKIKKI
jgi:hypothetical protein